MPPLCQKVPVSSTTEPVESDVHAGGDFGVEDVGLLDGGGEGFAVGCGERGRWKVIGMELRVEVSEHVGGGGADSAGTGERVEIPGVGGLELRVVALDEAGLQRGREGDSGVGHVERAGDLLVEEFGVGDAGAVGERLTEKADAEVAVFEFGVGREGDAVFGDLGVEELGAVVGVGVLGIGGREVAGHAWEAGVLIAEIEQGDLGAVGFGDGVGWEKIADGFVETNFLLLDHLREDERGEGLGDGADFEDGVGLGGAVGEDAADAVLKDADGDAGVGGGSECAVVECGGEVAIEDGLEVVGGDGRDGGSGGGGGATADGSAEVWRVRVSGRSLP